jgi:hypothetical protein
VSLLARNELILGVATEAATVMPTNKTVVFSGLRAPFNLPGKGVLLPGGEKPDRRLIPERGAGGAEIRSYQLHPQGFKTEYIYFIK